MAGLIPIPTTRVSDRLIQNRLLSQSQFDQQALFRIQSQISTGLRLSIPSDDAPAAIRAMGLQRLIERKNQAQTNLATNQSYLSAADTALGQVANLLADVRGTAISVSGTTSTDAQRKAAVLEIQRTIEQMVDVANYKFRDRFLFGGTLTTQAPFSIDGNFVLYSGNEKTLQSFADIDQLFESSFSGNDIFGAISEPVRGTADLDAVLSPNTKLANLNGGLGVAPGSISVSDGTYTSVIDLSKAKTIRDVARAIEAKPPGYDAVPPGNRTVRVEVGADGLTVSIDSAGGGDFTIREVGAGTTARQLGILKNNAVGASPIVGGDLNPRLTLTTSLRDILGSRAVASVAFPGGNNDLRIEADQRGAAWNGVTVQLVDDSLLHPNDGLTVGNETVAYSETAVAARASLAFNATAGNDILLTATAAGLDFNNVTVAFETRTADAGGVQLSYNSTQKKYVISVEQGVSTAADVVDAIELDGQGGGPFTANLDTSVDAGNAGAYVFQTGDDDPNAGNTGASGGAAKTLFVFVDAGETTANHVAQAINNDSIVGPLFTASLDGRDTSLSTSAGTGVVDLSITGSTSGGAGVEFDQQSGLRIVNGGKTFDVDISAAETIEDLLNTLNGSGASVVAEINAAGTGIDIRSRVSGADFFIGENGGTTAAELGVRSVTPQTKLSMLNSGFGVNTVDGSDDLRIVRSDDVVFTVDLSSAKTIQDVFDLVNNHPDNTTTGAHVTAQFSAFGSGIELVENTPSGGGSLKVLVENLSLAAEDLGFVPRGATQSNPPTTPAAATAELSIAGANNDLLLTADDLGVDLNDVTIQIVNSGAVTGDAAALNYDATNKILTIDVDPSATRAITVAQAINQPNNGVPFLATHPTASDASNDGTGLFAGVGSIFVSSGGLPSSIITADVNPQETDGIFNSLIRLADALERNDPRAITRAIELLDGNFEQLSLARAELGARQQNLDVLGSRLDVEVIELTSTLSIEIDTDLAAAISDFTGRQAALEASLRMSAATLQLSLLNFL